MRVLKRSTKTKVKKRVKKVVKRGLGIFEKLIDKLPVELHLPGGYNYCGPGSFFTLLLMMNAINNWFCKKTYRH